MTLLWSILLPSLGDRNLNGFSLTHIDNLQKKLLIHKLSSQCHAPCVILAFFLKKVNTIISDYGIRNVLIIFLS